VACSITLLLHHQGVSTTSVVGHAALCGELAIHSLDVASHRTNALETRGMMRTISEEEIRNVSVVYAHIKKHLGKKHQAISHDKEQEISLNHTKPRHAQTESHNRWKKSKPSKAPEEKY
jgi:hypothetical protein